VEVNRRGRAEPHGRRPSLREIYEDLGAIDEDFSAVAFDPRRRTVTAETEPVSLQGQYLGPFGIEVAVDRLGEDYPGRVFAVLARDPHPAGGDSSVTHPHVSGEVLCCGDATVPIRRALQSGRLLDALLQIRAVLNTYNPGSPYVSLDEWDGRSCYDCGAMCDGDYLSFCDGCEQEYCEECVRLCRACDRVYCRGCVDACPDCGESTCSDCRIECEDCGQWMCETCNDQTVCPCGDGEREAHDQEQAPVPPAVV
jgi:hypothetical protein